MPPGAAGPGPAGPPGAPPQTFIISFDSEGDRWAWIEYRSGEITLLTRDQPGGTGSAAPPAKSIAAGRGAWMEVALAGQTTWLLARSGKLGELLRLEPGKQKPDRVLAGLSNPGGLLTHDGRLYWIEVSPRLPGLPGVPAAGPTCSLKELEGSRARTVATWPGAEGGRADRLTIIGNPLGLGTANQDPVRPDRGDIVGISGDRVFIRSRRPLSTDFFGVSLKTGKTERLASEGGVQTAALRGQTLFWTAPSEEAVLRLSMRCVKRLGPNGPEKLTEWLPGGGNLVATDRRIVYVVGGVYVIPESLGPPSYRGEVVTAEVASDGRRVILLAGRGAPMLVPDEIL